MATFQIVRPNEPQVILGILTYLCNGNSAVLNAYGKRTSRSVDQLRLAVVAEDDEILYRLYVNKKFIGAYPAVRGVPHTRTPSLEDMERGMELLPASLVNHPELYAKDVGISRQSGSLWNFTANQKTSKRKY